MPSLTDAYALRLRRKAAHLLGIRLEMVIAFWRVEHRKRVWLVGQVRPSGARTIDLSKPHGKGESVPAAVRDLERLVKSRNKR